jgi:hypothetical protein
MGTDIAQSCPSARSGTLQGTRGAHRSPGQPLAPSRTLVSCVSPLAGVQVRSQGCRRQPVAIFGIPRAVLRVQLQTAMPSTPVNKATLVIYRSLPQHSSCATCNTNQFLFHLQLHTPSDGCLLWTEACLVSQCINLSLVQQRRLSICCLSRSRRRIERYDRRSQLLKMRAAGLRMGAMKPMVNVAPILEAKEGGTGREGAPKTGTMSERLSQTKLCMSSSWGTTPRQYIPSRK